MPVERGYESQVAQREGAALPSVNPRAYGVGLAQAGAELGDDIQRRALRSYELDRREQADREAADFDHRFALHRQNMDGVTQEMRSNAEAGGAGHVERWREANEAARESLLSGITDRRVLQRAQGQWDEYSTRGLAQEGDFAEAKAIAKRVTDDGKADDIAANRIRRGVDPDAFGSELKLRHEQIYSQHGLPDDLKEKLWDATQQKLTVAYVQHLQDTNPQMARAQLDAGLYDYLPPNVLEQLRNGADVEIRRSEAAAAHAASVAAAQTREQVQTVTALAGQGIDVSAQLPDLIGKVAALGDTSTVVALQGLQAQSQFARAYEPMTPLQVEGRIAELQAIPEGRRTPTQQAELKWASDHRGAMASRFNSDPVGWAIENAPAGMKPPPLSQGPAARAKWARETAGVYGGERVLTAAEAQDYANRAASGDAGYREVVDELGQFGGRRAMAAAKQVDANDRLLQQLVVLPPTYRRLAIDGREARRANPKILQWKDDNQGEAIRAVNAGFHQALATVPVEQRNAIMDIAGNIAANFQLKHGKVDSELSSQLWLQAMNMALGATGNGEARSGGLARWKDQYFLVPDGMTRQKFTDGVFAQAKQRPPVNPDGSPLYLGRARPVAQGNGVYRFYAGNNLVLGKDGQPWEFKAP